MSNELIINGSQNDCRIALLKDKNLVEFHQEVGGNKFHVGDVYLGTVRKLVPGLNAAFIDIGYQKDAFLHYLDLGPQFRSLCQFSKSVQNRKHNSKNLNGVTLEKDIDKLGKINQVLSKGQQILVQIVKEPISTKGPRLSSELSLAGRYIVLVPFSNVVTVSKKIVSKDERKRLIRLLSSIKPENFGVIIRTVAEGKEVADLDRDLRDILVKWEKGVKKLATATPKTKIIGELGRASSIMRDVLSESFDSIYTDNDEMYSEIKSYIGTIAPEKEKIVKQFAGKVKIFENFGIEKQLKSLFGQNVNLKNGGYLVIEHTEALHVIDVNSGNSGNKSNADSDQESTAFKTNMDAAAEVARQLRLRDMGGIIIVDFIDMKLADNKRKIFDIVREEMRQDRSKFTVLPLTKFGLMQITRQRVRPEMNIVTKEKCPTCDGTGKIAASILITDRFEENLDYILTKQNESDISISLHPFLHAYYTKGFISKRVKWYLKYNKWIKLIIDSSLPITKYVFHNKDGAEIEI